MAILCNFSFWCGVLDLAYLCKHVYDQCCASGPGLDPGYKKTGPDWIRIRNTVYNPFCSRPDTTCVTTRAPTRAGARATSGYRQTFRSAQTKYYTRKHTNTVNRFRFTSSVSVFRWYGSNYGPGLVSSFLLPKLMISS